MENKNHESDARPSESYWHLDKRLNVSHLIATAMLAVALAGWAATIDRRLSILEERSTVQSQNDARQDLAIERNSIAVREEFREMRGELRAQSAKIDRLLELVNRK